MVPHVIMLLTYGDHFYSVKVLYKIIDGQLAQIGGFEDQVTFMRSTYW
jgi:hypothetical protein